MEIQGAYEGSKEQRALAMKNDVLKNSESAGKINEAFQESIDIAHAVSVWSWVLTIAVPVSLATMKIWSNPGMDFGAVDWLHIALRAIIVNWIFNYIALFAWGDHVYGNTLAYKTKQLLLVHNDIIEIVSRLEKENPNIQSARLEDGAMLRMSVANYMRNLSDAVGLLWIQGAGNEERASLADRTISNSVTCLTQLFASKYWLKPYGTLLSNCDHKGEKR